MDIEKECARANTPDIAKVEQIAIENVHANIDVEAIKDVELCLDKFFALSGEMAGYNFVKIVIDRKNPCIHFINDKIYKFHAAYIAEKILGVKKEHLFADIDKYNRTFYLEKDRPYLLAILAFHKRKSGSFFTLETVEVDNMEIEMVKELYQKVRENVDQNIPIFFKPANHYQETMIRAVDEETIPRLFNYELFASASYVPLHQGETIGRLRLFKDVDEYRTAVNSIEWYDIIVMDKVPDDIPRVSGIINSKHTTPLSHTNVLASGWKIPNAISIGVLEDLLSQSMDQRWVKYSVELDHQDLHIERTTPPAEVMQRPVRQTADVEIDEPEINRTPIASLDDLRMTDRFRYGTKAANLGELRHILLKGSDRLLGYYNVRRPPRENLLNYLGNFLNCPITDKAALRKEAWLHLQNNIEIPRGIALPFSFQADFLTSSPAIQQEIGKLKMALQLGAREIDSLCLGLQRKIRQTRIPSVMRDEIDSMIVENLGGVSSFVVRSSSNAEDLENFSAAGIYESINHVTTADNIFESIKEVWASLISPRSVRLRNDVGIQLDDCYMGVIIQEEIESEMGGVMVTTNPANNTDFRNVFLNVSNNSVINVVQGADLPFQYLYNTVEGGGRTLSIGNASEDLPEDRKEVLQNLSFIGRMLQAHFSKDYTFSAPQDIEWASMGDKIYILQLRPYAT